MKLCTPVIELPCNAKRGRDFVIGDIHGCFGTVEHALAELEYDAGRDRLISVGDLIDHGTRSTEALEWIQRRFTAVIRGNHEQMMLEWLWSGARLHTEAAVWRTHWSSWWFPMTNPYEVRKAWFEALAQLPFAATLHTERGRIGVVHGQAYDGPGMDWDTLCRRIAQRPRGQDSVTPGDYAYAALWARPKVRRETPDETLPAGVTDLALLLHGHDAGPIPVWTARRALCIDTGVHWEQLGHLTVAEVQAGEPVLHRFARVDTDGLLEPPPRPAGLWDHGQGVDRLAFIDAMGTSEHPTPLREEPSGR